MLDLNDISTRLTVGMGLVINAMFLFLIFTVLVKKYSREIEEKKKLVGPLAMKSK